MAPPSLRPPPRPREHPPLPRTPPSIGREPAAGDGRDARPRRARAAGPGDDRQRPHRAGRVVPSHAAAADRDRGPRRRRGRRGLDLRPGRGEARPRCAPDRARRGHRTEHRAARRPALVAGLPRRGGPVPAVRHLEAVWRAGGSGAARRKAGATGLRRPPQLDEDVVAAIRERARRSGRKLPASIESQALLPRGAQAWPNPVGTAPGLLMVEDEKPVILLPGVPAEMEALSLEFVIPYLR